MSWLDGFFATVVSGGTATGTTPVDLLGLDVVCSANSANAPTSITKATPAALAAGGEVLGVTVSGASANTAATYATQGAVITTTLTPGTAGFVVVDSAGRLAYKAAPQAGDHVVGTSTLAGLLKVSPYRVEPTTRLTISAKSQLVGAKGDATLGTLGSGTDDSAALVAAGSLVSAGGHIYLPPGVYRIASAVTLPRIEFAPGAILQPDASAPLVTMPPPIASAYQQIFAPAASIRSYGAVFSVFWWGAVGDNVVDDQPAFQAACNAVINSNSGTIYIPVPPVTFRLNSSVVYGSNTRFLGDSSGFGARGSCIQYYGSSGSAFRCAQTAAVRSIRFENLSITAHTSKQPGTVGIDFREVSHGHVLNCSVLYFDRQVWGGGTYAGQYCSVRDCEIGNGNYGIFLSAAGNAWTVSGGRIVQNTTAGIAVTPLNGGGSVGNLFHSAFEGNAIGVWVQTGCSRNAILGYFEGNGGASGGAVQFDAGANGNAVLNGTLLSNASDTIVDNDGSNCNEVAVGPSLPASPSHTANGHNILVNGGFENDSNADGIADGWFFPTAPAAGLTASIDTTVTRSGYGASQKLSFTATSSRDFVYQAKVIPGRQYVLTIWTRTDTSGAYAFYVEDTPGAGTKLYNGGVIGATGVNIWQMHRAVFKATSTGNAYITVHTQNPAGSGAFWLDDAKLECGIVPTDFEERAITRCFTQLGNQIAAAATVAVTEPIHIITGSTIVTTITAPPSWTGVVTFIPRGGVVAFGTGGNILNGVLAANPFQALYDGTNWTILGDGGHSNGVVPVTGTDQTITPNGKFVSFTNGVAASIKTINPPYPGFVGSFIGNCASGALTFGGQAGSNIRGPFTPTQNKPFLMVLDPVTQYWMLSN